MTREQILEHIKELTDEDKKWLIKETQKNVKVWITKESYDRTSVYYTYVAYLAEKDEQNLEHLFKEAEQKNIDHSDYIIKTSKKDEEFQKWWDKEIERENERIRNGRFVVDTGCFSSLIDD